MIGDDSHTILQRVISASGGRLSASAAQGLLAVTFPDEDQDRIQYLAERNTEGELTQQERLEYDGYILIGELLALMQAQARLSLRNRPSAA